MYVNCCHLVISMCTVQGQKDMGAKLRRHTEIHFFFNLSIKNIELNIDVKAFPSIFSSPSLFYFILIKYRTTRRTSPSFGFHY